MKLVGLIYHEDEIDVLKDKLDAVMIEIDYLSNPKFSNYQTINIIEKCLSNNLIPIIKMNRMVHPFEISKVETMVNNYVNYDCLFYVTDLGLVNIFKKLGIISRVIYDPITMICNSLDAKNYYNFGLNAIGLSSEITLDDLNSIIKKTNIKAFYQIFGYRLMFHSKRNLISLYSKKIGSVINNDNLWIEEATRNDLYPIEENEQGTLIYRSGVTSLIKEIRNLKIEYAYIDHFRLNTEVYTEVVNIFHSYINNNIELSLAKEKLELLNLNYSDGFSYKDSVYQKEEF